jgi:branched-chain amino acid transport system substrate-binding protein
VKSIKQANELGLSSNRRLVALSAFITDIHAIGLSAAKNVLLTTGFYWNMNDDSRAWSKRFFGRIGAMPTSAQAGVYSSVLHYLRATKMAGSTDASKVAGIMRDTQVNDMFTKNGKVRADGRLVHDMYLVQVKEPSQSKFPWDYYTIVRTIPGDEASRSLADVKCPPSRK